MNTDFDFLLGQWRIANRRLVQRLKNSDEWETFSATALNQRLPAGIGNFDDFVPGQWRAGFVGMSLRIFNPQTACWSIYWLDNESGGLHPSGLLRAPVVGRFTDGIGIFEGEEELDGRTVRVRYTWTGTTSARPHWEQAMSADGGATWEINWQMSFERDGSDISAAAPPQS